MSNSTDSSLPANRIVLSEDLRSFDVPNGQDILGCVGDAWVRKVWFDVPRFSDGIDLSGFELSVHYANDGDQQDIYTVKDAQVSDDRITFYWLVGPVACAVDGTTIASIKARKLDGENIAAEFNSTIQAWTVLPANDSGEAAVVQYSDAVSVLINTWQAAEAARASAESARVTAESQRKSAETSRVGAESARVTAENLRVQAENARVSEAAGLKAASEAATGAANTAASKANVSAANADNAAQRADTAALAAGSVVASAIEQLAGSGDSIDEQIVKIGAAVTALKGDYLVVGETLFSTSALSAHSGETVTNARTTVSGEVATIS